MTRTDGDPRQAEEMCVCGHTRWMHYNQEGRCHLCDCVCFRPAPAERRCNCDFTMHRGPITNPSCPIHGHPEPPVGGGEQKKCRTCYGYGLHMLGDRVPMGPVDAQDGMPTIVCPECGADANPTDGDVEYRSRSKPPVGGGEVEKVTEADVRKLMELARLGVKYQALLSRAEGLAEKGGYLVDCLVTEKPSRLAVRGAIKTLRAALAEYGKGKEET